MRESQGLSVASIPINHLAPPLLLGRPHCRTPSIRSDRRSRALCNTAGKKNICMVQYFLSDHVQDQFQRLIYIPGSLLHRRMHAVHISTTSITKRIASTSTLPPQASTTKITSTTKAVYECGKYVSVYAGHRRA